MYRPLTPKREAQKMQRENHEQMLRAMIPEHRRATWAEVIGLWDRLPESAGWGEVRRIYQCAQFPRLVRVFSLARPDGEGNALFVRDTGEVLLDEDAKVAMGAFDWVEVGRPKDAV